MGSLSEIYIKKETLEILAETLAKKGEKGISLTISTGDQTNEHGQNVSVFVSQTKEQREEKKSKYYVGNGKVFWTDGKITVAEKREKAAKAETDIAGNDDLPF